ncbi:chain length determinant protein [Streptomyces sp. NBC_01351]|uniref:chain length determinant protein n=1 Tax=Streptomyces sp. NBC_01351 TaxID=2903833 RepID=UPI002E31BBDB|nr:chain length determinant protein [Streptomyces sp. NBC_01351]
MDLAEIWRVMRRRWYVLLPGLLITAALVVGVHLVVPVTYRSQSTVTLLNSQKATEAYDGNPFLSTQTSLTGMADGLARNLNSDASLADLKELGVTGTTEAKIADNALGPFMWLIATGSDPDRVLESDRKLTAYAEQRLTEFQSEQKVAPDAMIRMATIVPPQKPVAETKTRLQYLVMAGGLGLVLSIVAAFYVEARKRSHKPEPKAETGTEPETEPEPETQGAEPPEETTAPIPSTEESVVERTLAIRRPPKWARSAAPPAAVPSAAEPLDEESTHGHRPRTGQ